MDHERTLNASSLKATAWNWSFDVGNYSVFCVCITVFVLFGVMLITRLVWLNHDGRTPLYIMQWPPRGTKIRYSNPYLVIIVTGSRRGSGTEGILKLTVHSPFGLSRDFIIPGGPVFEKPDWHLLASGNRDHFLIVADVALSDISYINIELKTKNKVDKWYLSYIVVYDLKRDITTHLQLHEWIIATRKSPVFVTLSPSRHSLFQDCVIRGLKELHLWLAVWLASPIRRYLDSLFALILLFATVAAELFANVLYFLSPASAAVVSHFDRHVAYLCVVLIGVTLVASILQLVLRLIRFSHRTVLDQFIPTGCLLHLQNKGPPSFHRSAAVAKFSNLDASRVHSPGHNSAQKRVEARQNTSIRGSGAAPSHVQHHHHQHVDRHPNYSMNANEISSTSPVTSENEGKNHSNSATDFSWRIERLDKALPLSTQLRPAADKNRLCETEYHLKKPSKQDDHVLKQKIMYENSESKTSFDNCNNSNKNEESSATRRGSSTRSQTSANSARRITSSFPSLGHPPSPPLSTTPTAMADLRNGPSATARSYESQRDDQSCCSKSSIGQLPSSKKDRVTSSTSQGKSKNRSNSNDHTTETKGSKCCIAKECSYLPEVDPEVSRTKSSTNDCENIDSSCCYRTWHDKCCRDYFSTTSATAGSRRPVPMYSRCYMNEYCLPKPPVCCCSLYGNDGCCSPRFSCCSIPSSAMSWLKPCATREQCTSSTNRRGEAQKASLFRKTENPDGSVIYQTTSSNELFPVSSGKSKGRVITVPHCGIQGTKACNINVSANKELETGSPSTSSTVWQQRRSNISQNANANSAAVQRTKTQQADVWKAITEIISRELMKSCNGIKENLQSLLKQHGPHPTEITSDKSNATEAVSRQHSSSFVDSKDAEKHQENESGNNVEPENVDWDTLWEKSLLAGTSDPQNCATRIVESFLKKVRNTIDSRDGAGTADRLLSEIDADQIISKFFDRATDSKNVAGSENAEVPETSTDDAESQADQLECHGPTPGRCNSGSSRQELGDDNETDCVFQEFERMMKSIRSRVLSRKSNKSNTSETCPDAGRRRRSSSSSRRQPIKPANKCESSIRQTTKVDKVTVTNCKGKKYKFDAAPPCGSSSPSSSLLNAQREQEVIQSTSSRLTSSSGTDQSSAATVASSRNQNGNASSSVERTSPRHHSQRQRDHRHRRHDSSDVDQNSNCLEQPSKAARICYNSGRSSRHAHRRNQSSRSDTRHHETQYPDAAESATACIQNLIGRELADRIAATGRDVIPDSELRMFATDVVHSLYTAVRCKLEYMLDKEYGDKMASATGPERQDNMPFPKEDLLEKADSEVREQVLPVIVDHIVWLMKEEAKALGQLDCDMMMVAFAGEYVDTIVTNAVLKTHVDLEKKRAYTKTFVVTSSGTGGDSVAPGTSDLQKFGKEGWNNSNMNNRITSVKYTVVECDSDCDDDELDFDDDSIRHDLADCSAVCGYLQNASLSTDQQSVGQTACGIVRRCRPLVDTAELAGQHPHCRPHCFAGTSCDVTNSIKISTNRVMFGRIHPLVRSSTVTRFSDTNSTTMTYFDFNNRSHSKKDHALHPLTLVYRTDSERKRPFEVVNVWDQILDDIELDSKEDHGDSGDCRSSHIKRKLWTMLQQHLYIIMHTGAINPAGQTLQSLSLNTKLTSAAPYWIQAELLVDRLTQLLTSLRQVVENAQATSLISYLLFCRRDFSIYTPTDAALHRLLKIRQMAAIGRKLLDGAQIGRHQQAIDSMAVSLICSLINRSTLAVTATGDGEQTMLKLVRNESHPTSSDRLNDALDRLASYSRQVAELVAVKWAIHENWTSCVERGSWFNGNCATLDGNDTSEIVMENATSSKKENFHDSTCDNICVRYPDDNYNINHNMKAHDCLEEPYSPVHDVLRGMLEISRSLTRILDEDKRLAGMAGFEGGWLGDIPDRHGLRLEMAHEFDGDALARLWADRCRVGKTRRAAEKGFYIAVTLLLALIGIGCLFGTIAFGAVLSSVTSSRWMWSSLWLLIVQFVIVEPFKVVLFALYWHFARATVMK